jgi:hypothetical protein
LVNLIPCQVAALILCKYRQEKHGKAAAVAVVDHPDTAALAAPANPESDLALYTLYTRLLLDVAGGRCV